MKCEHKDGWIMKTTIVIDPKLSDANFDAECECNTIGCRAKKTFKFDVVNVEEVKE